MKLSDIYKKSVEVDERKFEVIRSDGTMSGEFITLIDPFSKKSAQITHMYDHMTSLKAAEFDKLNAKLLKKSQKSGDYTEFNLSFQDFCQDIRDAYALELIESWSFDNELNHDSAMELIEHFRFPLVFSIDRQIINSFKNILAEHSKK